jgi:hypothetical protein
MRARSPPRRAGPGGSWRGKVTAIGARCAHEWSVKIWPKASQVRDFLLSFIFAISLCLINFDKDRPSRLRDAITLGRCSL